MITKALIIGFGSSGRRHAEILESLLTKENILVLTRQKDIAYNCINSFDNIKGFNPDYIIVASETSKHFSYLKQIESSMKNKTVLIEKPLFDKKIHLNELRNNYFVGYNLRFHPLINKLKEDISTEDIFSVDVVCNSYLPDWRNTIPYEDSSSASKVKGGGVLLDLSHEIDYINYIFGDISHLFSENIKLSKLDIDTDDYLSLIGKIKKGGLFTLNMKYFSFNEIRRLSIETNLRSIVLDILNSKITYFSGDKVEKIESDYLFDSTYLDQHKAILDNDFSKICSLDEGIKVMEMIDSVQKVRER